MFFFLFKYEDYTLKEMKTALFLIFVKAYTLLCEQHEKEPRYHTHPQLSNCDVQRSGSSSSAGTISQQQATCKYNVNTGLYYQSITWKPTSTSTLPTSSYMLKVVYGMNKRLCFRFNASVHMFQFDKRAGFRPGRYFR